MASSIPASVPAEVDRGGHGRRRPAAAGARRTRRLVARRGSASCWRWPSSRSPRRGWRRRIPTRQSLRGRLAAPTLEGADGRAHLLGTDHLGRDVLSRVIWGARVSLLVGFAAVVVGGLIGATLGILAGFRGGWTDSVIMTLADAQLAFPFILLAIGIIAVLGPSFPTLIVVIGLVGLDELRAGPALAGAGAALARVRGRDPRARRLGRARIVARHILPNVLSSLVVIATLELARSIVLEATLSFLGLGIQPPTPSWGGMVHEGREYLDSAWWISTYPGPVLMLTSLVVSRTGDWLRDLLDPTLRGSSGDPGPSAEQHAWRGAAARRPERSGGLMAATPHARSLACRLPAAPPADDRGSVLW